MGSVSGRLRGDELDALFGGAARPVMRMEAGLRTVCVSRYEQPAYTVVSSGETYEIRRYESHLVAETIVDGDFESTGNVAFRRLAGFIFGRNSEGARMQMTVPVTHEPLAHARQRYRFVMERAFSEDTLPQPLDANVEVVRVPAGYHAVLVYRGGRGERRFRRGESKLLAALERDGIPVTGTAVTAVYDGPTTPPILRRNEVLIPVEWTNQSVG